MMHLRRAGTVLLSAWLLSACSAGALQAAAADPNAPPGEVLLAAPPAGWQEKGVMQTPALRMAEYGPATSDGDRLERLTLEAQSGRPLPDPIEFVLGLSRDLAGRCDRLEDSNVASGYENGYPTAVRLMICPKLQDGELGEVVMAKAIQGNERFYVVTRRLRVAPFADGAAPLSAQEMAEWSAHLGSIRLCDPRRGDHSCPADP